MWGSHVGWVKDMTQLLWDLSLMKSLEASMRATSLLGGFTRKAALTVCVWAPSLIYYVPTFFASRLWDFGVEA